MKTFTKIVQSLGLGNGAFRVTSGGIPDLTYRYNQAGAGFQASLVTELTNNPGSHVTIYQNTWDGQGNIPAYGEAPLGPHGVHVTNSNGQHVFFKIEDGLALWQLSDNDPTLGRAEIFLNKILEQLGPHIL